MVSITLLCIGIGKLSADEVQITFRFDKSAKSISFAHAPSVTWDGLENGVSSCWVQFSVERFQLYHGDPKQIAESNGLIGVKIIESNFRDYFRNGEVFTVLSKCKGFSQFSEGQWMFYKHSTLALTLTTDPDKANMKQQVIRIVRKLVGMIFFQKDELNKPLFERDHDNWSDEKRQKT